MAGQPRHAAAANLHAVGEKTEWRLGTKVESGPDGTMRLLLCGG